MDPYVVTRIGDVTIERVLPKQDQLKKDVTNQAEQISQETDIDTFLKINTSINRPDDEGGGSNDMLSDSEGTEDEDEDEVNDGEHESEESDEGGDSSNVQVTLLSDKTQDSVSVNSPSLHLSVEENKTLKQEAENTCSQYDKCGTDDSVDMDSEKISFNRVEGENLTVDDHLEQNENFEVEDENSKEFEESDKEFLTEDKIPEIEASEIPEDLKIKLERDSGDEDDMIVIKQEPLDKEAAAENDDSTSKRKMSESEENDKDTEKKTKKTKTDKDESSDSDSESNTQSSIDKSVLERKVSNLRRNIREVMDETQLDEATLAAQRQEMERLRRVQEQQRLMREVLVNKQITINRQNSKAQTRVVSLLQSNSSVLKSSTSTSASTASKSTSPNTVLVKLSSGTGAPQVVNKKVLEILRSTKSSSAQNTNLLKTPNLSRTFLNKPHMMTPSVSIAPVKPSIPLNKVTEENKVGTVQKSGTKPKGKDVVTISSSSSDEDDCILISEPSGGEESDQEEDTSNSGMHTNDLYNVPDEHGRVLINVGRPENEPDVFLAPQIARIIKPHQIGGVRFLFDNVVESLERFKTSTGFGCILAHSMGLGKTLQVVSFCDVFLRYTEARTVLCIMPINTLQNWLAEFNMWLPADISSSHLATHGEVRPRTFPIFVLNDLQKSILARAKVVTQWSKEGGVLLIGYELYRQLSLQRPRRSRKTKKKMNPEDDADDEKNKPLLEEMHSALVKPGPDLIICDEGHRIKNSHASISQALKQIRSKRRVVLTGYPLQNNLLEYWCMVDFVRPNYLGTKTEFSNMFERPIQNGQCIDSTPQDIRLMRYRAHVLHSLLEGFVQRRSHSVLQNALPQKEEYVLLVRMTKFQRKLYDTFMNEVVRTKAVPNPLKAFAVCCKIWNHPDVLYEFLKKRGGGEAVDLDLEETAGSLTPSTPNSGIPSAPSTPGTPAKRGRGRSPKANTSPTKRERKTNTRRKGQPAVQAITKSPAVAAVVPNVTSSKSSETPSNSAQTDNNSQISQAEKPLQNPGFQQSSQFGSNYNNFPAGNNSYPSYPSNAPFPNYSHQQQGEYSGQYSGYQNSPNYNNPNFYQGYSGYYPSTQDHGFSGGNYWNNSYFNNDSNGHNFYQNFGQSGNNSNNSNNNNNTPTSNNGNNNFFNHSGFNSEGFNSGFNNTQINQGFNSNSNASQQVHQGLDINNQGNINSSSQGSATVNQNQIINSSNNNNQNQTVAGINCENQVGQGINSQTHENVTVNVENQNGAGSNSQNQGIVDINSQSQPAVGLNVHNQSGSVANIQSHCGTGINSQSQGGSEGNLQSSQNQNAANQVGIGIVSQNQCSTGMPTQNQSPGNQNLTGSQQVAVGTVNDKPQNDLSTTAGQCGIQSMLCSTANQNFGANQQNQQPAINNTVNSQQLLSQHNVLNSSHQQPQNIIRQDISQNQLTSQHIVNNLGVQNQLLNQLNPQNAGIRNQNSQNIINGQQLPSNTLINQQNFHNTVGMHQPYTQNIVTGQQTIQLNNQSNSQVSLGNTNILGSQQNLSSAMLNAQSQQNSHILLSQQNPQNVMLNQQNPQSVQQVQQNNQNMLNNSSGTQNVLGNQQNSQVFSDNQCPQNIMNTQQTVVNGQQNNQNLPSTQHSTSNILNNSQNQQNIVGSSHSMPNNPQLFGNQNSLSTYSNLQLPQNILNNVQNPPSRTGNASSVIDSSQNSSNVLADSQNHGNLLSSSNVSDNVINNMCGNIQQNSQNIEHSQPQNMQGNLNPHLLPVNAINSQITSVGPQNFASNSQIPQNMISNSHNVYNPNVFPNQQNSQMHNQQGIHQSQQNIQNLVGSVQNQQNMLTNVQNPQNMFRGLHGQQNAQHPQNVFSSPHNTQTNNNQNQFSSHQNITMLNGQQIPPNVANIPQNSNIMSSQQNLPNFVGTGQANIHQTGNIQPNVQNMHDNQYNSNSVQLNQQGVVGAHPNGSGSSSNINSNNNMSGEQQNMSNMRLVQSMPPNNSVNSQSMLGNSHNMSAILNNQHIAHNQQNSQNVTNFQNVANITQNLPINSQSTAPSQHTQQTSQSQLPLSNQPVAFNQNLLVNQPSTTSNQSGILQNQQGSTPNQHLGHGNINHPGMMLPHMVVDNQQNSIIQNQQAVSDNQSVMSSQLVPRHNQPRVNMGATNMLNPLERQQNVFGMNSNQGFVNNQTTMGVTQQVQPQQNMPHMMPSNNNQSNLVGNQQSIGNVFNSMNCQNTILNQQESRLANSNTGTNQAAGSFGGANQLNNMINTFSQQGRMNYQSNVMNSQQGSYGSDHQGSTFNQPNNPGNHQASAFSQAQSTNTFNQAQSNTFSQSQQTNLFSQSQQQSTFSHNQQQSTFSHNQQPGTFGQNQPTNTFNQNQQASSQSSSGTQSISYPETRSNSGTDHSEINQNGASASSNQGADLYGNSMDSDNIQNYRGSQIGGGFPTGFPQNGENLGQGTSLETGTADSLQLTSVGTNTSSSTNDFGSFTANNENSKTFEQWNDSVGKTDMPSEKLEQTSKMDEVKDEDIKTTFSSTHTSTIKTEDTKPGKCEMKDGSTGMDDEKQVMKSPKPDDQLEEGEIKPDMTVTTSTLRGGREDPGIPYDWATELMKGYTPGDIEASAKMVILFCILEESMALGDRVLVFSQSLFTLNLVEDFLQKRNMPGKPEKWAKNWTYYRLDGSTSALEREKLINEFNSNPNIHLFLVSTRAGSLGINLVGANRVVVLDASWNPCHDTQAVCRVYRYGQRKPCFVYRLVMDNCLEKKIYDRQINKQGMADRVVDECNPDAHLSIKEVTNLCWDNEEDTDAKDFSHMKDKYIDVVMQKVLEKYSHLLSKGSVYQKCYLNVLEHIMRCHSLGRLRSAAV